MTYSIYIMWCMHVNSLKNCFKILQKWSALFYTSAKNHFLFLHLSRCKKCNFQTFRPPQKVVHFFAHGSGRFLPGSFWYLYYKMNKLAQSRFEPWKDLNLLSSFLPKAKLNEQPPLFLIFGYYYARTIFSSFHLFTILLLWIKGSWQGVGFLSCIDLA